MYISYFTLIYPYFTLMGHVGFLKLSILFKTYHLPTIKNCPINLHYWTQLRQNLRKVHWSLGVDSRTSWSWQRHIAMVSRVKSLSTESRTTCSLTFRPSNEWLHQSCFFVIELNSYLLLLCVFVSNSESYSLYY
jgi:hypothetical protein